MKVLFISRAYGLNSGGMERLSHNLINHISQHPVVKATKITHTRSRRTSPLFVFTVIPCALWQSRQVDIVHLGDPMLSLAGWLIKHLIGKKVIVSVHGLDVLYKNRLYQLYLWLFFRSFDLYLPISQAVAKTITHHKITAPIKVINPGIPHDHFNPKVSQHDLKKIISPADSLPANHIYLLTSGRLVKRKGHVWFVSNVLCHLPEHVHYIIAGTGPELTNIKKAINSYNLNHRVHLLGHVTSDQLRVLYNSVHAFVQPNLSVKHDMEGFGLVLLEAAMCQLTVFASNLEGITDAIIDGQNGHLIEPGNKQLWLNTLLSFIDSPKLNHNSRQFTLQRFSWASYVDQFISHTQSLF